MTKISIHEADRMAVAEVFAYARGQETDEMAFRAACEALAELRSDLEYRELVFCVADILSLPTFRPLTESTIPNLPIHHW